MLKPPVNFIDSSFAVKSKSRIKHFNIAEEFFSTLPFIVSTMCCLFMLADYANINIYKPLIASIVISSSVIACAVSLWGFMLKYTLVLIIAYFAYWLKFINFFREGLSFVGNRICVAIGISQTFNADAYNIDKIYFSCNLVFWTFAQMLILLGIFARNINIARLFFFVLTFAISTIGMYNNLVPNKLYFVLLVFSWIFIFITGISATNKLKTKQHEFQACFLKYTAVCCVLVYVISNATAGIIKRPEKVNRARKEIFNITENYSASEIFEMVFDPQKRISIFKKGSSAVGVSNPKNNTKKMGETGELKLTHTPVLNVTIKNAEDIKNTIYLHAYSCENYNDGVWTQNDNSQEIEQIISDMAYPNIYNIGYELAIGYKHIDKQVVQTQITIEETGADRSLSYIPYFSKPLKNQSVNNYSDLYQTIGKNTYTLYYCDFIDLEKYFDDIFNGSTISPNILENFDQYQEYVNKNYMQVDSEVVKQIANNTEYMPVSQKISQLKKYFDANYYYSLSPDKTPDQEDFVDYFLTEQDCGYCEYFASAGTLLCRAMGIPARYAAGYKIEKSDLENAKKNKDGSVTVTVLSDSAHAWTEIYSKSTGWIPVDFTVSNDHDITDQNSTDKTESSSQLDGSSTPESSQSSSSDNSSNLNNSSDLDSSSNSSGLESSTDVSEYSTIDQTTSQTNSQNNITNNKDAQKISVLLKILSAIAILTTIAILTIIIRKIILWEQAQIALNSKNSKQSIDFVYNRYLKLLKEIGIYDKGQKESSTDLENMKELQKKLKSKGFERFAGDLNKLTHLAIEVNFGSKNLTGKQREELSNILDRLEKFVKEDKLSLEIFILKYIKCIIR